MSQLIHDSDVLDVFRESEGILLIMDEKHLSRMQQQDKTTPLSVTYRNTLMQVEEVHIGQRGRIGVKLKGVDNASQNFSENHRTVIPATLPSKSGEGPTATTTLQP